MFADHGKRILVPVLFAILGVGIFAGCSEDPQPPPAPAATKSAPQPTPTPKPSVDQNAVGDEQAEKSEEVVVKRFRPVRDPFKSAFSDQRSRRTVSGEITHPLQQFSIGQLKLLGIIWGVSTPVALISTPSGDEYVARAGTPVGTGDGKVVAILPDRVVIVERYYDYRGQLQTEKYEMVLADEGN